MINIILNSASLHNDYFYLWYFNIFDSTLYFCTFTHIYSSENWNFYYALWYNYLLTLQCLSINVVIIMYLFYLSFLVLFFLWRLRYIILNYRYIFSSGNHTICRMLWFWWVAFREKKYHSLYINCSIYYWQST